jgi:anti-sigma factor RsiW
MNTKPMDLMCQQVVELVNEYLGHKLTDEDRRAFDAHLEACPPCTTYLEQIRSIVNLASSLRQDSQSADVEPQLLALFRLWCDKRSR